MTDPTALPSFPPQPPQGQPQGSPVDLRGRVVDILSTDGFRPDVDTDGDVAFKMQGQQLFVRCMEGEVDVMRVFGQWALGDEVPSDTLRQLQACNDLTLGLNIVKAGLANGTLVVTTEHLIEKGEDPAQKLRLSVNLLLGAVQMWHENVTSTDVAHAADTPVPTDPTAGLQAPGGPQGTVQA